MTLHRPKLVAGVLAFAWLQTILLQAQDAPIDANQVQGIARLKSGQIEITPYLFENASKIVAKYPVEGIAPRDVPVSFDKSIPTTEDAWKSLRSPSCTFVAPLNQELESLRLKIPSIENQGKLTRRIEILGLAAKRYDASYNKAFLNPHLGEKEREEAKTESNAASKDLSAATNGILASLLDAPEPDLDTIQDLIRLRGALALEQKAVFGEPTNYDPRGYKEIYKNSRGICEIWRTIGEKKTIGSGILIGERLILTANHVVGKYTDSDFVVRFHEDGQAEPQTFSVEERKLSDPVLDACLLVIKADQSGDAFLNSIERPTLSTRRLLPDEGLYVVGFPNVKGPPKVVHDSCFAIFPSSVTKSEFGEILHRVISYELNLEMSFQTLENILKLDPKKLKAILDYQTKDCIAVYGFSDSQPDNKLLSYFPKGGLYKNTPLLGLDSDTYEGDSGGGVFSKAGDSHPLVALFLAGQSDRKAVYHKTWTFHEKARPIAEIAAALVNNGFKDKYKINITDK